MRLLNILSLRLPLKKRDAPASSRPRFATHRFAPTRCGRYSKRARSWINRVGIRSLHCKGVAAERHCASGREVCPSQDARKERGVGVVDVRRDEGRLIDIATAAGRSLPTRGHGSSYCSAPRASLMPSAYSVSTPRSRSTATARPPGGWPRGTPRCPATAPLDRVGSLRPQAL